MRDHYRFPVPRRSRQDPRPSALRSDISQAGAFAPPGPVVVVRVVIIMPGVRVLPGKRGLGCPQAGSRRAARLRVRGDNTGGRSSLGPESGAGDCERCRSRTRPVELQAVRQEKADRACWGSRSHGPGVRSSTCYEPVDAWQQRSSCCVSVRYGAAFEFVFEGFEHELGRGTMQQPVILASSSSSPTGAGLPAMWQAMR